MAEEVQVIRIIGGFTDGDAEPFAEARAVAAAKAAGASFVVLGGFLVRDDAAATEGQP
jgi:uncharacterized Rossmann fold enzyme